ncbi:MAG: 50S ribosomal protein L21 [Armatimonadetes bacterium]|nr:50S ribosomal protein L21 [Armatimonadota bacterium]NIM24003.1 50S ribosomal protein L21 [Armatimonadota bacterium]NIM67853.1 50S ribosomal protein L21 [Armatimonadota bacterium]NIM76384.1 50S ribosomal protein L21 [Armatimonadota bacterium]NIN06083.1 50S ribosomal protein L21 [Armatimonadota bacterium]
MYAIIETGGKQYRVEPEEVIEVEKVDIRVGEEVVLDRVLLVNKDGKIRTGQPYLKGARAVCRLLDHDRGKKVDVFTYKAKDNVRRKKGHRQAHSRLKVEKILLRAGTKTAKAEKETEDGT